MARAKKIWVVCTKRTNQPMAAFTVKREAKAWLDANPEIADYHQVMELPDGGSRPPKSCQL